MDRRTIGGTTRLAGIVGWPLAHTLSPVMHNAAYEAMGLDWVYVPLPVEEESGLVSVFEAFVALGFVGVNVTMPYKQAALTLCDEVATPALMAGAVNAVHLVEGRLIGYNTDGRGLLESLSADAGFTPEGRSVALLGAGGAAGAAFVAFVLGDAARVSIINRSLERAEGLLDRMRPHLRSSEVEALSPGAAGDAVRSADLVVNATPLGMRPGDDSPVPVEWLRSGQVVADMVYTAHETAFLAGAKAAGATALGGLGMLVCQGALSIDIWTSDVQAHAPRDVMRQAAEAAMASGQSIEQGEGPQ